MKLTIFHNLKLKWKLLLILVILLIPTTFGGLVYTFDTIYRLQVQSALSGLMNFVDAKQQGIIRFIGSTEKLAMQMAVLVNNARPEVVQKQFETIVATDVFKPEDHQFNDEITVGSRSIATWRAYHAIDFVRRGVIEISSDSSRVGRKVPNPPDLRHGYSDVYMEGDIPIFTVGANTEDGTVYIHNHAGMLTIITNGEIGNLEGDMGAYYLAGVGKTFDFYITNRDNVMITDSRVFPDALLKQVGSEFPWQMTLQDPSIKIDCLPDGSYLTNVGHYTGCREAMGFYAGPHGKEMLGASMPFYDSEWTIVVEQEASELLGPLYLLRKNIGIGAAVVVILTLISGLIFVFYVTRPLTDIIGVMGRLMKGDLNVKVHAQDRGDEIGDMANAIEAFKDSMIRKAITDEELIQHRDHLEEMVSKRTAEVKAKADQLERALEREREYNVLQQKFVSLVSHEFRTPLSIIDSTAQRMIRRKDKMTADEVDERANKVRSAVTRMVALIDATLYASSLDEGKIEVKIEPCDIRDLLEDVCNRQSEISPNHQIQIEAENLPDKILADPRLLDQVFTNLLSNAVKYAPDAPHIEVRGWNDGDNALISITDQGVGIPEKDLPHMFGRFFRAKTADGIKGTGIGLSVAKEFIQFHGGSIGVDSMEGQGTTLTVRLPVDAKSSNSAPPVEMSAKGQKQK